MSIQNCQLTCRDGKLCCAPQTICVKDCAWTVTVRGGPFNVVQYPTGNTNEGTIPYGVTPVDGTFTVAEPGVFTVELDCGALDGTPCPDPLTAPYVCWHENCINGLLELQILEALEALCEKVVLGNDAAALAEILLSIQALCTKMEGLVDVNTEMLAELTALCTKLLSAIAAIESVCEKLEDTNASLDALCDKIEKMIEVMVSELQKICKKLDTVNESLETICKKLDAILALLTAQLAAMIALLTSINNELNSQGLTLDAMLECLEDLSVDVECPVKRCYDIRFIISDGNLDSPLSVMTVGGGNVPLSGNSQSLKNWLISQGYTAGELGDNQSFTKTCVPPSELPYLAGNTAAAYPGNGESDFLSGVGTSPGWMASSQVRGAITGATVLNEGGIEKSLTVRPGCEWDALFGLLAPDETGVEADVSACCTGGATPETAFCFNVSGSLVSGDNPNCTYSLNSGELPTPYTQEDFLAALPEGSTMEQDGENWKVCSSGGNCLRTLCRSEGGISLSRVCFAALPNTAEPVCVNFERTWDKWSEPTANIIAGTNSILEDMFAKQCEQTELDEGAYAKLCIMEEHLNPAGACPAVVPPEGVDKEAQTLTLEGNVVPNYAAGQSINLQNANGESCGEATVAEGEAPAVYNAEANQTVIQIVECELDEGKTPQVITQATPVPKPVKAAIKVVKALAIKKALAAEPVKGEVKGEVKVEVEVRPEITPERG